ncbi:hypothetical protein PAMP_024300 [Pampus punctatissimus]
MAVSRTGLLLLCAVLAVTRARRSSPEQEDVQEKINSARCTSRCLTLHMTQLTAAFRHLQVSCNYCLIELQYILQLSLLIHIVQWGVGNAVERLEREFEGTNERQKD